MKIVGCDLHTRYQQIGTPDEETVELVKRRFEHVNERARRTVLVPRLNGKTYGSSERLIRCFAPWRIVSTHTR